MEKVICAAMSERDNHHSECKCFFCEAVDAHKKTVGLDTKEQDDERT